MKSQKSDIASIMDLHVEEKSYTGPENNTFFFGILMLITQVVVCFVYGFLGNVSTSNRVATALEPSFLCMGQLFLGVVGFGLLFSYVKKMIWSSLGFNLFICCLTIQLFFLINVFWTKANIGGQTFNSFQHGKEFQMSLSNSGNSGSNGCALSQAIKCSIANMVIFSAIMGKAGPLQAWIVVVFGTVGYELNRNIVNLVGFDYGGTCTIFVFGGFVGIFAALIQNCKYRYLEDQIFTAYNRNYTGSTFSVCLSLIGAAVIWAMFPLLTLDPQLTPQTASAGHFSYTGVINVIYALASSTMMCIATSCVVNEMLHVRDVVEGSIAGAVACASASFYLVNPVYALVIGSVSGVVQALAQNMIEKRSSRTRNILNTFSFVTFGVQGVLGSAFASLFRAVLEGDANRNHAISDRSYTTSYLNAPVFDFVSGIISGTMGTLIGVLMGVVLLLVAKHSHRREHFHDFVYWINDDGIRYSKKKTDISLTEPKIEPIAEEKEQKEIEQDDQFFVREKASRIQLKHSYI